MTKNNLVKRKTPFLLGIDVGTSVSKSVLFDYYGEEIYVSRCKTKIIHPYPNHSEANMMEIWGAVKNTIRELISKNNINPNLISAVGICATMGGVWLLNRKKKPFCNAILWNDGRAISVLSSWEKKGIIQDIFNISGNLVFAGMTLPILRWIILKQPQLLHEAKYTISPKDWIRYNLTGEINTDETDISQVPCDITKRKLSYKLFEICDAEETFCLFPPIINSGIVIGKVTKAAANETGLKEGTPVITGLLDAVASTIGSGSIDVDNICSIIGTSFLNNIILDEASFLPNCIGFQFLMPSNLWIRSFANTSGTMNIEWFIKNLGYEETLLAKKDNLNIYDILEERAKLIPIGSEGVIFHPYLNSNGVSAPFKNAAARAQFFGIQETHSKYHLLRAVYEGLAFSMRDLFSLMPNKPSKVFLVGGGARSSLLCQIFADCTGMKIFVPKGNEFGNKGVAILAGIGIGIYKNLQDAKMQTFKISKTFEPIKENKYKYDEFFELYRKIYERNQENWWQRYNILEKLKKNG